MTMIDERALRSAIRSAADAIAVPERGVEDILAAARRADAPPGVVARFRRHRDPVGAPGDLGEDGDLGTEGDPEAAGRPGARRPRRLLVATMAAAAAVVVSVTAGTLLAGSPTSNMGVSSTPSTTMPLRSALHGALGAATSGSATTFGLPQAAASPDSAAPGVALGQAATPPLPAGAVGQSSKVEETGSLDLSVRKGQLESVVTRLTALATAQGGFVAGTQTQSGGGPASAPSYGSITLQVPQASFGTVVAQAQTLGKVTALTTKATDVTGQYVDLQARISALQASRDQYLTIMSKATSINDILAVQNQLDSLQTQIEQLQGQLQVLDGQTTFSTLAVTLSEPGGQPVPVAHAPSGIASAWHGAVSGFAAAFDGLVRSAGPALFVLLCLAALTLLGRLAWRGVRRRTL